LKRFLGLISGAFALFFVVLAGVQPAVAASAGCLAINSLWGGGVTVPPGQPNEVWQEGLQLNVGDVVSYTATSSGSAGNAGYIYSGSGFAIYRGAGGMDGVELEEWGNSHRELNLNSSFTVTTADQYVLYSWGGDTGTTHVTASCVSLPEPTVTSLSIASGPMAGGTVVTIGGTRFDGVSAVKFGSVDAASFSFVSSTQVVATAPAHAAGVVNVSVTATTGTSAAESGNQFTYQAIAPGAPGAVAAVALDRQASVTFAAPASDGGAAITSYTVTSSPGNFSASGASSPLVVTGLDNGTAYTFTVTATNSAGTGAASAASAPVTPKGNQTISFANPGAQTFGTSPTLTATATSGLAPTFSSSTSGVCTTTSGGTLSFITAGSCTIDADQAGDAAFNAGTTVTQTFTVNAVVPMAPTIGTASAGVNQATVTFTAPASTGGTAITSYTVTASPGGATATGASSPITVTGLTNGIAHTFTVTASNGIGTGAASSATNSVTPAAQQTITFANPGAQTFGTSPTLTASTTASGLTPTFTSSTSGVCTITPSGTLTFVSAGTCVINADQAGDSAYLAAPQVSRAFTVIADVPGAPGAATAIAGDTQASIAFTAPATNGGGTITGYTVTSNPGGMTGTGAASPIIVTGLTNGVSYTFTVTATNSAGTGPASAASNSIAPAASQTITFTNPGTQNFGTTPTLTATADSGLTPTFTTSTMGVCTITSNGALTFVSAGTCTVNADQPGNSSYLAANQVSQSFTVSAVVSGAPMAVTAVRGDKQASVSFTAPVSTGGSAITGYTVTSSPEGRTGTGASSPVTVSGLTNGVAYTFTVTASNSAGTSSVSAPSNSVTPEVGHVITLSPASGALPDGMVQEIYAPKLTASGNVGALSFGLSAGTLPPGLNVDGNGAFVGTIDAAAVGSYSFSITATDTGGGSTTGNYTINVVPRAVTAEDKAVVVPPGATPMPVNLSEGATGGPFDTADVVSVSPPHAGTARIVGADVAALGGPAPTALYLKFTPNPQFSGTAVITYTLHSALGLSNVATVSFTTTVNTVAVEDFFGTLSNSFVKSRAGLLAGAVEVPGIVNRRSLASASAPGSLSVSPSGNSISMNFAASTLAAAASAADTLAMQPVADDGINFWIDGTATLHVRSDNGSDHWGSFALLSAGGDVLLNDKLLVGLALHVDWMDDITDFSRANGTGVLIGPYVSAEIGEGVFLDASAFYGRSWNTVSTSLFGGDFETDRLLARAKLEGQWALSEALTFRPSVNALYLQERAGSYTVEDGLGNGAVIDAFTTSQLRLSLGGTLQFTLDAGDGLTLQPFLGGQFGFSLIDGAAGSFGTLTTGFDLLGLGSWTVGTSAELGIDGTGMRSLSGKARVGLRF